ncbi:hypothetical protein GKZ68_00260 [Hymenobacter sp. BRD128]|uniref:hypothetical protein n=1 Tax=Hymenobacter sp. BRD128 TaxID=2675878 RepID=UPI0015678CEB|nr:hypothetical protein [Hymenobacter sp. BRD128]QKG55205.1 hypothetical protein GKZ68_00260 [Hymenobacter sp. BRD128]
MQEVLRKLGGGAIAQATLDRVRASGAKASLSLVYKVIAGTSTRQDIADAFLSVAEEEAARRRQVEQRARQLVAEA